jgi:hypothetical protein
MQDARTKIQEPRRNFGIVDLGSLFLALGSVFVIAHVTFILLTLSLQKAE